MIFRHTAVYSPSRLQFSENLPLSDDGSTYISPKKGLFPKGHHSPAGEVITPTSKLIRETNGPKLSGYQINVEAVNKLREKIKTGVTGARIESELRQEIERLKLESQEQRSRGDNEHETVLQLQLLVENYVNELMLLRKEHTKLTAKAAQSEKTEREKVGLQTSYHKLEEAFRALAKERDGLQSRLEVSAPSLFKEIEGEVENSRLQLEQERNNELRDSLRRAEADNLQLKQDVEELRKQLRDELTRGTSLASELRLEIEALDEDRQNLTQKLAGLQEKSTRNAAALETSYLAVNAMSSLLKSVVGDGDVLELFSVKPSEEVFNLIVNGAPAPKPEPRLSGGSSGIEGVVPPKSLQRKRGLGGNGKSAVRFPNDNI